jgi:hypothetical protein
MKILNLHICKNGLMNGSLPNGGMERAILDLHYLLKDHSEIKTVCSSNENLGEGFLPINFNNSTEWRSRINWSAYCATIKQEIADFVPDLIILHGANRLLKVMNDWGIPVLFYDHQQSISINKMYHESFYPDIVDKNRELGGLIYSVSKYSCKTKAKAIVDQKIMDSFEFDGWTQLQYVTEELQAVQFNEIPSEKGITIGRSDADKNPQKIEVLRKKGLISDYYLLTMFPFEVRDKTVDFFNEKIKNNVEIFKRTHLDLNRKDTLELLAKSKVYVSTSPTESAGITAIEAFSLGIPVIFITTEEDHASTMFLPTGKGKFWIFFDGKNVDEVKNFLSECQNVRKEIYNQTRLLNSAEIISNTILNQYGMISANMKIPQMQKAATFDDFFS